MITLKKKSLTEFEAAIDLEQGSFDLIVTLEHIHWDAGDSSVGVKPSLYIDIESVKCTSEKVVITDTDAPEEAAQYELGNKMIQLDWRKAVDAQKLDDELHDILEDAVWRLEKAIVEELESEF